MPDPVNLKNNDLEELWKVKENYGILSINEKIIFLKKNKNKNTRFYL